MRKDVPKGKGEDNLQERRKNIRVPEVPEVLDPSTLESYLSILCKRERERLEEVFRDISIDIPARTELGRAARDLVAFARGYYEDALWFLGRGRRVEAFELFNYVWGLLDAAARLGLITPHKTKKYFKVEQD